MSTQPFLYWILKAPRSLAASAWLGVLLAINSLVAGVPAAQAQQPQRGPQAGQRAASASEKRVSVMAVVNGQAISRQHLADEAMRRFGTDALESIVNKLLVLGELNRQGIRITEGDINQAIIDKAAKFDLSAERYLKLIQSQRGIKIDKYKNDIVWNELALRKLAEAKIQVTPQELADQMEFEFGPKVQVRQIAMSDQQAANTVYEILQAEPEQFEKLAKQHSEDTNSAALGGLLPPVRRNSGFEQFENVAFSLQPGEISEVFSVQGVFVILRCERVFPAEELSAEQKSLVKDRLIDQITQNKLRDSAVELFKQLQESAQITNVLNDPKLSKKMPGVAAVVNGQQILKNQVAEDCITRFGKLMLEVEINRTLLIQELEKNGVSVEQADIDQEIERAAEEIAKRLNTPDGKISTDQYLAYVTGNDLSKADFYIEDQVWPSVALKKLVQKSVQVTDEDMQKGYEANFGPGVEVLAIVLEDMRTATKVWKMAASNPTEKYFGTLAQQYSIEPASKNNFGEVPPIQRHSGQPDVEREAFSLSPGEISKVTQIGEHWTVMYCKGRTTPRVADPEAVQEELRRSILEKKLRLAMQKELKRIHEDAQIDNFLAGTSQTGKALVRSARAKSGRSPLGRRRQ